MSYAPLDPAGTLRSCRVFAVPMLERGWGRIVIIASVSSFVALFEVAALTKSLAVEWGQRGVNVNANAPGFFPTEMNRPLLEGTERGKELLPRSPLGRFGGDSDQLMGEGQVLGGGIDQEVGEGFYRSGQLIRRRGADPPKG